MVIRYISYFCGHLVHFEQKILQPIDDVGVVHFVVVANKTLAAASRIRENPLLENFCEKILSNLEQITVLLLAKQVVDISFRKNQVSVSKTS
jgi:hypothetical protein